MMTDHSTSHTDDITNDDQSVLMSYPRTHFIFDTKDETRTNEKWRTDFWLMIIKPINPF